MQKKYFLSGLIINLVAKCLTIILTLMVSVQSYGFNLEEKLNHLSDARTGKKIKLNSERVKAVIFFNYLVGCPIVKKYLPEIKNIKKKYGSKIMILNLDSSLHAEKESVATIKHLNSVNNDLPLIIDHQSEISLHLKLTTASEVAVIDTRDYIMKYKGAIDDRITLSFDRPKANNRYLIDIVDSILVGKNLGYSETEAQGCLINLFQKATK